MVPIIRTIDKLTAWFAKSFAWCIVIMTFAVTYEVFVRYVLRSPTSWSFDITYMMYGALFMMGGAYTLSRDGHVRGDFIYRYWPARRQAAVELVLYIVFFYPGVLALVISGWKYAARSLRYFEVSQMSPAGVPIYQFKMIIVAAGLLLAIQGVAQVLRCVYCLKTGGWLPSVEDVEEMEKILLANAQAKAAAEPQA